MADPFRRFANLGRLILDTVGDGVLLVDRSERITLANPAAGRLLGQGPEDLVGRTLHAMLRSPGPNGSPAASQPCPICITLASRLSRQEADAWLLSSDGTRVPVDYVTTPILDARGPAGVLVTVRDTAGRRKAEKEIQRQREALYQREKVAAMGSLLADMAHELNNPLSVIIAGAAILTETEGAPDVRARAAQIEGAAQRCALVVRSFLALARQRPQKREPVSLNDVIREVLTLAGYQLRVADVEVLCRLAGELPTVWGDPNQLNQLVMNLVTNARHAMRDLLGPRLLTLTTRVDAARREVVLEVADTGPGIPRELRARVFEPFFTTKPVGEGTGLGLPLCAGIVGSHGGTLRIDDQPRPGAVFVVRLPVDARAAPLRPPAPEAPASGRRGTILVVDDETDIARMLADVLVAHGHTVETVSDGARALDELERHRYDVILSDMRMPTLDGAGFYRELERRHPELVRRIIFMTGDALGAENRRFLERTRASSLLKPFDVTQVRIAVQKVLDG